MTKKSIGQLIVIGIMPLFILLNGPANAADKAADAKKPTSTLEAAPDSAQKDPNAFEQGSGATPSGPDTNPEMKQQQPHDVDKATVTGSPKDSTTVPGGNNKQIDAKAKTKAPQETSKADKAADAKESKTASDTNSDGTQKDPDAFEESSGTIPSGPDTNPEMKQQQPHSIAPDSPNPDSVVDSKTGSTKEEAMGSTKKSTTTSTSTSATDSSGNKELTVPADASTQLQAEAKANARKEQTEDQKKAAEAQKEAEKERVDNAYQAAIDNCDQFSGGAKNECIAKVRTKYAR